MLKTAAFILLFLPYCALAQVLPPVITAQATPNPVITGRQVIISWSATGTDRCRASWSNGADIALAGTYTDNPKSAAYYHIGCDARLGAAHGTIVVLFVETKRAPIPPCLPFKGNFRIFQLTAPSAAGIWNCEFPDGVLPWVMFGDFSKFLSWADGFSSGSMNAESFNSWCEQNCRDLTPDEKIIEADLLAKYGSRAMVRKNSTYTSRPVYTKNPDGTRGAALSSARVAIGARCSPAKRLKGTDYYSVAGEDNVATPAIDILGDVYTLCDRTDPIGVN